MHRTMPAKSTLSARRSITNNYQMGQLFASQLHRAIAKSLYPNTNPNEVLYNGNPKVGAFMKEFVFTPGRLLSWNALTKFATGEELNAKAFAPGFSDELNVPA